MFLIGCLALPIIGGIEFVRAGARPASNEGQIVFERSSCIWVMDADGRNEKQLTTGRAPVWSPDGKQIAFSRRADGLRTYECDIYIMNADGSNIRQLTGGPENDSKPAWSPDGKQIAFIRQVQNQLAIYVMDADGSNVQRLTNTPQNEMRLDWTAFSHAVELAGKLKTTWGKIKCARELFGR